MSLGYQNLRSGGKQRIHGQRKNPLFQPIQQEKGVGEQKRKISPNPIEVVVGR